MLMGGGASCPALQFILWATNSCVGVAVRLGFDEAPHRGSDTGSSRSIFEVGASTAYPGLTGWPPASSPAAACAAAGLGT